MWVYQQSNLQNTAPAPEAKLTFSDENTKIPAPRPAQKAEAVQPAQQKTPAAEQTGTAPLETPELTRSTLRRGGQATRDCLFLAGAYLFGAALAGVAHALCETSELNLLAYYLDNWYSLFSVEGPGQVLTLFAVQYLTVVGAITALLVLGLCAFGPVLIYLFTMLYGFGIGLIGLQLFFQLSWGGFLGYLLLSGLPAAGVAACLCFFGASALQVSSRLQRAAFGRRDRLGSACGARLLLGQYLMFDVILLPICGIATGLACLDRADVRYAGRTFGAVPHAAAVYTAHLVPEALSGWCAAPYRKIKAERTLYSVLFLMYAVIRVSRDVPAKS